jgi:putative CocE/NonD family hydrolase
MVTPRGIGQRIVFLGLAVSAFVVTACGDRDAGRVSEFGRYEGYSEPRFEEWVTSSRYLEMRDGVKLAIDVVRPAVNGVAVDEPLPVVWTHSRYHRNPRELVRMFSEGGQIPEINSMVDAQPDLQRLVRHGYVVAAAGVRGSGASYGRYEGLFSPDETRDAYEITEWLASQSWSDGNVGMYGGSYLAITQYMAASQHPPSLKAIFPNLAVFDMYDFVYPGGVYRDDLVQHWGELTIDLDENVPAPRVDADVEGAMLREAIAQHADNFRTIPEYRAVPFRDSKTPNHSYATNNPSAVLDAIQDARVPAYHFGGWYDVFVTDATLWYANYEGPQKLGIGAWSHGGMPDSSLMAERARLTMIEEHRWFDYWLKGIDNGIMDEPPIHYATMVDPGQWTWQAAETWPPPGTEGTPYYFSAGPSGAVTSVNDGLLTTTAPGGAEAFDAYQVDLTTTTGTTTRWDNAVGAAPLMIYPDLSPNDAKSLTYTTPPLDADVTVTGHPAMTLYVTSSEDDADFHVLLEEVDEGGFSHYVTEGVLRASHRDMSQAPWDNVGLPYQRSFAGDQEPLPPGQPTELVFDLHPTSTVFNAGHRIRVTVMGADADNTEPPPVDEAPTIRVYRDGQRASHIVLPVQR